ncbi:hypothetical protein BDR04DRAFT_1149206 [Suillus decipiens]|nr:hypothetical protein BDR04DRAFT_1149206 [Suillus decipiens]
MSLTLATAGHGKTILASSIIDDIQRNGEAELAYFYCCFRYDRTRNVATVLRSLVVQLLQQSKDDWITFICEPGLQEKEVLVSLRNVWQQHCFQQPYPTDTELLRKLLVEASTLVRRPVLVIDAIEECKDHPTLVEHLVSLAEDARLQLLVTGRSHPDIKSFFRGLPTHLDTQERLLCLSEELKQTILKKLSEKAEGMFRWVQCQLDIIIACKRPSSIRKALNDLPAGLDEMYDRMIESIGESGEDEGLIAQRCLLLVTGAFIPLTLDQLNEAMMIEVGQCSLDLDLRVTNPCRGFVTYDEKTGIVALSHLSVKEYLISRPNKIFKSASDIHARICELLVTYMLYDFGSEVCTRTFDFDFDSDYDPDIFKDNSLLKYAILGWKHLGHVSDEDPDSMTALSRLNSEFRQNDEKHCVLNRWLSALSLFQ